ncbi:MAG TPA: M48 family metallopeptidase [Gemmatimonadaceae bacterium]|nr:M48 family metallopeptidase [Gemmatimonadaceae bacterium]
MSKNESKGNLFAQQEANRKASRRLVAGFIIFIAWLGFGGDLIWYLWSSADATRRASEGLAYSHVHMIPGLGILMLLVAGAMSWWGYRFGATSLIKATGGREIIDPQNDLEQRLVNVVDEMKIASGTPRPRIWIIPDDAPNAFATGVDQTESHLAVTEGLLETLSRDELQAVVGHEMGHIANLDVRLMTLLTALVGVVALVHNSAFRMMRFGDLGGGGRSRSRSRSSGDSKGAGALVIVLLVVWIISWIIAPLVTRYMAMKVGRSREYLADAMSAQFTRNPSALADALQKISASTAKPDAIPKSSAQLCIIDPFNTAWNEQRGKKADLMASHPPLQDRVARLRAMAYQANNEITEAPPISTIR